MGFLFSKDAEEEPKAAPPSTPPAGPEAPADADTFGTMEMMAKTLRDVGADDEAAEVERQIESLKKSLRKMDGNKPFSTVAGPDAPEPSPRDVEAYADLNAAIDDKHQSKNAFQKMAGAVL